MRQFPKIGHLLLAAAIHGLMVSSTESLKIKEIDSEGLLNRQLDNQQRLLSELAQRSLRPEEITKLEIDAAMWQRLRYDPDLQPIVEEVQKDLIAMKWGELVDPPAWKKYGEKAYPLLDYYSQSHDYIRQQYGFNGIYSLGKPYTTRWLEKQIKRNPRYYPSLSTASAFRSANDAFGLDDPATRDRLVRLAKQHVDLNDRDSLNYVFLEATSSGDDWKKEEEAQNPWKVLPEAREKQQVGWHGLEVVFDGTETDFEKHYDEFKKFSSDAQEYILSDYQFDRLKVGEIPRFQRLLLHRFASDSTSEFKGRAIMELERHSDPIGKERIGEIVDDDLRLIPDTYLALYYLKPLTQRYPASRFSQGCREYEAITGKPYFEDFSSLRKSQEERLLPTNERIQKWEDWLQRYPDHPGADDATYRLIQAYYERNDVMPATRLWIKMLSERVGDGDVAYRSFRYFLPLLDVGLTVEQMETLLPEIETKVIAPIFRYALAVKHARLHNYARALEISQNLESKLPGIAKLVEKIMRHYQTWDSNEAQSMLPMQRQRWQKLLELQRQNTPEARYQIAANWAIADGYQNGYMALWHGDRTYKLPVGIVEMYGAYGEWLDNLCERYWVCDVRVRGAAAVRTSYQLGNPNAVAIALLQNLLDDPITPASVREKTLYTIAATLIRQHENFYEAEQIRIHPPARVKTNSDFWERGYLLPVFDDPERLRKLKPWNDSQEIDNLREKTIAETRKYYIQVATLIKSDYRRRIGEIVDELKRDFPKSTYIDDLLFEQFFWSDPPDRRYLQEIVEKFPYGDRAREARYLLDRLAKGLSVKPLL